MHVKRLWIVVVIGMGVLTVGCQAAGLSGAWTLSASVGPLSPLVLSMDSALTITYALNGCTISSVSAFGTGGWEGQEFAFRCTLGEFSVDSQLRFDPSGAVFDEWKTKVGWSSSILSLSSSTEMTSSTRSLAVSASLGTDPFAFGASLGLGANGTDCPLAFKSLSFSLKSPGSCGDIAADLGFACTGFSSLALSLSKIEVPGIPWLTLTGKLTYKVDAKTLTLSPSIDLIESACFEVLSEIDLASNLAFTAWNIYGLAFSFDVGAVSVDALSYLDDAHTIEGEYWESLTIGYNGNGCCGPVAGNLSWYFLEGGLRLFDAARLRATTSLSLSSQLKASGIVDFDLEAGACDELALTLSVSW